MLGAGPNKVFKDGRTIFFLSATLLVVLFLLEVPRISLPLLFAYVLSLILRPLRPHFTRGSWLKQIGIIAVIVGLAFLLIYPLIQLIPELNAEAQRLQIYLPKIQTYLQDKLAALQAQFPFLQRFDLTGSTIEQIFQWSNGGLKNLLLTLPNLVTSVLEWVLLVPLFLFFFLRDGRKVRNNILLLMPNKFFERSYFLAFQFNKKFGDYIFAKAIEAIILGSLVLLGLALMDFPFAMILGIVAGLTNIIPYIGPLLGFLPALGIALVDQQATGLMGPMLLLFGIANFVDLAIVFPLLVSKIVNLHPLIVVVSVLLGSQIFGVLGMVLSIPAAAFFKLVIEQIVRELYPRVLFD